MTNQQQQQKTRQQYDYDMTSSSTLFLEIWCISPMWIYLYVYVFACARTHTNAHLAFDINNNTAIADIINWQPYVSSSNNNNNNYRYIIIGDTGMFYKICYYLNSYPFIHIHCLRPAWDEGLLMCFLCACHLFVLLFQFQFNKISILINPYWFMNCL